MKTKIRFWFQYFAVMVVVLFYINSCKKDDNNLPDNPVNDKSTAVFNPGKTYGTITDIEGNVYKTINIGMQTWMAENLRTTKYRDGQDISKVTNGLSWINMSTSAYCNYSNTSNTDTIGTFGRLYNWYAVTDKRNIAPLGWHVPTDEDWIILINFLDGEDAAGGKLKETGTTHWNIPNTGATNESGFTALSCGIRGQSGDFFPTPCEWWSSTQYNNISGISQSVNYDNISSYRNPLNKHSGSSVRCIKD